MNLSTTRDYGPLPLFLSAAVFILAAPVFWLGVEAPGADSVRFTTGNADLYRQVCPVLQYGFSRLRAGELPLWNSRQLCGAPFFANPEHGLLQPLNVVFLVADMPVALALHAFLALSFMGFFFVVFMRSMGVRYIPAVMGGILYACCGATAAAMSRPAHANALVWLPLLCWSLRWSAHHGGLLPLASGTVSLALLLLSGSPLLTSLLLGVAALYGMGLILWGSASAAMGERGPRGGRMDRAKAPLAMLVLALLLTSIQWMPTLSWALSLEEADGWWRRFTVAGEFPRGLRGLLAQLLEAHSGAMPPLGYLGASTLLVIPAAFLHAAPKWERTLFGLLALLLVVAALADRTGGSGTAVALVYPAIFAVGVLAALGVDRLFTVRRDRLSPRLWGPLLLIAALYVVLFIAAPAAMRGRMIPAGIALLAFALFHSRRIAALSGVVLALFLFIDLSAASVNRYPHPFFTETACMRLAPQAAALVAETALDDRLLISAPSTAHTLHGNIGMSDGFRVANASGQPLTPGQREWWRALGVHDDSLELDVAADAACAPLLNVMAVRAVAAVEDGGLAAGSAPGLRLRRRGEHEGIIIYANENIAPRIGWARSWRLALDMSAAIDALCDPAFNPRHECVVIPGASGVTHLTRVMPDSRWQGEGAGAMEEQPPRITLLADRDERIEMEVVNTEPGVLVVADTWSPDWRAVVNGQKAPILLVNGLFRGLALPAGNHDVVFAYRPRAFLAGAAVSFLTLGVLLLSVLIYMGVLFSRLKNNSNPGDMT